MKGLAVIQLFSLKMLMDSIHKIDADYNFTIIFLSGEETGGKMGANKIVNSEILELLNPKVVFGEGGGGITGVLPGKPTDVCYFISIAEKQNLWLKLDCKLKTHGHGSISSKKNANKILFKTIEKIERLENNYRFHKTAKTTFKALGSAVGGTKGFVLKNLHWWILGPLRNKVLKENEILKTLVTNSYQLTQINNEGGAVNQVAQQATAYYDCRLLPYKGEKPLFFKYLLPIIDPKVKISVLDESPTAEPSSLDQNYEFIKKSIQEIYPEAHVIPALTPATSDNSYFRNKNIPTFGFFPFHLNLELTQTIHAQNERIPTSAIFQGITLYKKLLCKYL